MLISEAYNFCIEKSLNIFLLNERIHKDFCPGAAGLLFLELFLNGLSYSAFFFFFCPGDFIPIKTMFQRERRYICLSIYFLTQGSNPSLLHWQADSLPLSHQGSPTEFIYHCNEEWYIVTTVVLNGLPWKRTEFILSFLRLHPNTAWF